MEFIPLIYFSLSHKETPTVCVCRVLSCLFPRLSPVKLSCPVLKFVLLVFCHPPAPFPDGLVLPPSSSQYQWETGGAARAPGTAGIRRGGDISMAKRLSCPIHPFCAHFSWLSSTECSVHRHFHLSSDSSPVSVLEAGAGRMGAAPRGPGCPGAPSPLPLPILSSFFHLSVCPASSLHPVFFPLEMTLSSSLVSRYVLG